MKVKQRTDTVTTKEVAVNISVGRSRTEKEWQNKSVTWGELVQRLSTVERTPETVAEYKDLSHAEQANLKDRGGFVGGAVVGDRRVKGSVPLRQVLTLDMDSSEMPIEQLDYLAKDVWSDGAYIIHTTRSHTMKNPRYRCVLILSRPCNAIEYEAVGRALADEIGIANFDPTTFQMERLMYFPTASRDGIFEVLIGDGDPFNVEQILNSYKDYRDYNSWAYDLTKDGPHVHEVSGEMQEDPIKKKGFVGAFCRAYSITEALDLLIPQYYQPSPMSGRYYHVGGTTTDGVVIYEDKWLYSHHGSDPNRGKLLNAFDTVRLTLYGSLDFNVHKNTKADNLPSYEAMVKRFASDPRVIDHAATQELLALFEELGESDEPDPAEPTEEKKPKVPDWYKRLRARLECHPKTGDPLPSRPNLALILEKDPHLLSNVTMDTFKLQLGITGDDLAWDRYGDTWRDADDASARVYIETVYNFKTEGLAYADAFDHVMQKESRRVDSAIEFIERGTWDGVERAETLFIDTLGVEDTPLNRKMSKLWLKALVARQYKPGAKFDNMLLLSGREGIGKSTILRLLAGGEFFTDNVKCDMESKQQMELLQGVLICEISELAGMDKKSIEEIKALLSRQVDTFRPAYGRHTIRYPRRCIIAGTTNETEVLRGQSGNRRMWVMKCNADQVKTPVWEYLTPDTVDQVWAEAREWYKADKQIYLSPREEMALVEQQESFYTEDPLKSKIIEFLLEPIPSDFYDRTPEARRQFYLNLQTSVPDYKPIYGTYRGSISAVEVLVECIGGRIDDKVKYKTRNINNILRSIKGLSEGGREILRGYGRQRIFIISDYFYQTHGGY